MSTFPSHRFETADDHDWDQRVWREARHQELIEATFDRAEAYERLGDFEQAAEWLDRAARLSGDLPPAYRAQRELWTRAAAVMSHRVGSAQGTPPAPGRR